MLNLFKKAHKKILEAHQTLKILCLAISSHIIFFWFLLISGHFQTTQNELQLCGGGIFRLSQKEKFLEPIKKNPYFVINTGEPVSATMSITLFW